MERKGFVLRPKFVFIDGRTGATIYSESYREEVLYNASDEHSGAVLLFRADGPPGPELPRRAQQPEDQRHPSSPKVARHPKISSPTRRMPSLRTSGP